MSDLEDLLRDSLRQRAEDVDPTPALWQMVDRRIARRRRLQVASWALAGAAAAIVAMLVIPGVVGSNGPGSLEIEPGGPRAAGAVPSTAAVVADGDVWLLDLTSGERAPLGLGLGDDPVAQLAVAPGSTLDDYRIAVVQSRSRPGDGAILTFDYGPEGGGVTGILEAHAVELGFVPTLAWSSDGELIAYTVPGGDGEANVVIEAAPDDHDGFLEPREAAAVGTIGEDDVLLDWVGPVADAGDTSQLWVRRAGGTVGILDVEALGHSEAFVPLSDGSITVQGGWGGNPDVVVTDVVAAVAADPTRDVDGLETYLLAPGRQTGLSVFWAGGAGGEGDRSSVEVPLGGVVGDVDLDALWLDASQDAALIGDGQRMWLFTHDGRGDFRPAVEVATDVAVGALFDVAGSVAQADRPVADPGREGSALGDAVVLSEPTVLVGQRELTLIGPSGATPLVALGEEGSERFLTARVRPGSTVDDLTVVALTTTDGQDDLRHLHVVGGRLATWEVFEAPYNPRSGGSAGDGASTSGPVWSPDGQRLAWFEWGTGPATLRTIGWNDGPGTGDPATDNAMFTFDEFGATPLVPIEWAEVPGSPQMTEIRAIRPDANEGWFAIPLEIQADGAVSLPGRATVDDRWTPWDVAGSGNVEGVGAAFAADGSVAWMLHLPGTEAGELIRDPSGAAERFAVPADLGPGGVLPGYFLHPVGRDVLVGSRDTGIGYLATSDGVFTRLGAEVVDVDGVD